MMRAWPVLVAALFHPPPVDHIHARINADESVTVSWTLPIDPTVVGVTIFRENLDHGTTTIVELGMVTSYTDTTAEIHDDYRYWVHTRDAEGDLSTGAFVEVFDDPHDDDGGSWACWVWGVAGSGPPSPGLLAAGLALALMLRRRR
jgi:hypothetical protein